MRFAESNDWMASNDFECSAPEFVSAILAEWPTLVYDGLLPGMATGGQAG
jgi:hypothetical protein